MKTADQLKPGEKALIQGYQDENAATRLLELGCLPGCEVVVVRGAPLKGPIYLKINGSNFALRREEVHNIILENSTDNGVGNHD